MGKQTNLISSHLKGDVLFSEWIPNILHGFRLKYESHLFIASLLTNLEAATQHCFGNEMQIPGCCTQLCFLIKHVKAQNNRSKWDLKYLCNLTHSLMSPYSCWSLWTFSSAENHNISKGTKAIVKQNIAYGAKAKSNLLS